VDSLLAEQQAYYRARAPEYDQWWLRQGRFDHGEHANSRWFADVAALEQALAEFGPRGDILELACGTGLWTRHLVAGARRLVAVDGSPEVLAINRARLRDQFGVEYVQADLFEWSPAEKFDVCFFGFWLSHVPESKFDSFWAMVRRALRPDGRVFFADSARSELSGAADHQPPVPGEETMTRRLSDGSEFRVVKRFYEPAQLQPRLATLGWDIQVRATDEFFIYGFGAPL
jgi:SAM-dependent methyltransferase